MRFLLGSRRPAVVVAVGMVASATAFVPPNPAGAASIVHEEVLLDVRNAATPNPADSTCPLPGIVRNAKVWVSTYVSDNLGRYNGMKFSFWTTYRRGVAAAKESFRYQFGREAPCAFLNSFNGVGEVNALRRVACENPNAVASVKPNRWCEIESRLDSGRAVPRTVDLNTENCRAPRWNNGHWGPLGWASWHNQHVKLQTTDVWEELGVDWIPGHFNIDTYAEDFEMLSGVANMDPESLQPADDGNRFIGYGKVQTAWASELWVRFYDAVARARGVDPIADPVRAHDRVAANAIANNATLTINLYPELSTSQPTTVRVGDYKRNLFQYICAGSPWVKDTLGDTHGPRFVIPTDEGPCDVGFTFRRPASSTANGYSFFQFVKKFSPDDAAQLKQRDPLGVPAYTRNAQIIQEAFDNRDTRNPMKIQSPTDQSNGRFLSCQVERNLGVSRGSPTKPDGSPDVDVPDPHFRRLFDAPESGRGFRGYVEGIVAGPAGWQVNGWVCNNGSTAPLGVSVEAWERKVDPETNRPFVDERFVAKLVNDRPTEKAVNDACATPGGTAHRFTLGITPAIMSEFAGLPLHLFAKDRVGFRNEIKLLPGVARPVVPSATPPPPPPPPPPPVCETPFARHGAFQANTTRLWRTGPAGTGDTALGMMPGTSPSVTTLSGGGYQIAFQANTGELWTTGARGTHNLRLGMAPGTSPSITALANGGYQIAFQANTTRLWVTGSAGTKDTGLGMLPGTSPSITTVASGQYRVAFQANTTRLWTYDGTRGRETELGMQPGTSPSITALPGSGYQIAFQANTTRLWTFDGTHGRDTGLGMAAGTSPSITTLSGGGTQVAFQANTTELWTTGARGTHNLKLGMMPKTSPSITGLAAGAYQIAFQANTSALWSAGTRGACTYGLGMEPTTSPVLA